MAELLELANLKAVMADLAKDIEADYKEQLVASGRYTQNYGLINSIRTEVHTYDGGCQVIMHLADYWKYVEQGVKGTENTSSPFKNPGWKAFPHILNWVEIKPLIPKPFDGKKAPTQKQLAYLVTRKIVEKGTKGSHDLERTKDGIIPFYIPRIKEALEKDVGIYLNTIKW